MAEEIRETEVVAVSETVEVTLEPDTAAEAVVVDRDDALVVESVTAEEPVAVEQPVATGSPVATYYAPRGKWDFTEGQRIVTGVLIWLNILVLIAGYMALTGYLGA